MKQIYPRRKTKCAQTDRLKSDNRGMNEDGRRLGQKHLGQKYFYFYTPTHSTRLKSMLLKNWDELCPLLIQ